MLNGFPLKDVPHVSITPLGGIANINFGDNKNELLLAFYGLTGLESVGGALNLQFHKDSPIDETGSTGFNSADVLSGDVANAFVPVPPAVWLFGSGLLGLAGLRFRRNRA